MSKSKRAQLVEKVANTEEISRTIHKIAKETLKINILDAQYNDSSDFHDIAVWNLKAALEAAYRAGAASAKV